MCLYIHTYDSRTHIYCTTAMSQTYVSFSQYPSDTSECSVPAGQNTQHTVEAVAWIKRPTAQLSKLKAFEQPSALKVFTLCFDNYAVLLLTSEIIIKSLSASVIRLSLL